jgi:hypothetical protein
LASLCMSAVLTSPISLHSMTSLPRSTGTVGSTCWPTLRGTARTTAVAGARKGSRVGLRPTELRVMGAVGRSRTVRSGLRIECSETVSPGGYVGGNDGCYGFATQARHLGKLREGRASPMCDSNHVVAGLRLLGGSFRAQSHDNECSAYLAIGTATVLLPCGSGRRHLGVGVAHDSSRSARASFSRMAAGG